MIIFFYSDNALAVDCRTRNARLIDEAKIAKRQHRRITAGSARALLATLHIAALCDDRLLRWIRNRSTSRGGVRCTVGIAVAIAACLNRVAKAHALIRRR